MFKKILIFALSSIAIKKVIDFSSNKDCFKTPHWFYFYIDNKTKKITIKCKKVNNEDRFFVMKRSDGLYSPIEIKLNSELGIYIRVVMAEVYDVNKIQQNAKDFTSVAETVRNRLYSECFKKYNYKKYSDVIFDEGQYGGINQTVFHPQEYFHLPKVKERFILSIVGVLNATKLNSNTIKKAECFNKSATISDCGQAFITAHIGDYYFRKIKNC